MAKRAAIPTREQWGAYQSAFDYFNCQLFSPQLPACMLNFSRKAKTGGFYCPATWSKGDQLAAEISLNPDLLSQPPRETMAILVHEMVHHWQSTYGTAPRSCYHDAQWAREMIAIGLYPSSTGAPGGKTTGQSMHHYILANGPFASAYRAMPRSLLLPWCARSLEGQREPGKRNKSAYVCPGCAVKLWGRPGLNVSCLDCNEVFEQLDQVAGSAE